MKTFPKGLNGPPLLKSLKSLTPRFIDHHDFRTTQGNVDAALQMCSRPGAVPDETTLKLLLNEVIKARR